MKTNALHIVVAILMVGLLSIIGTSSVLADGHETEGEMSEEKPGISGWFQIDIDSLGSYFLIGASHPIGNISIASNVYINDNHKGKYTGEFDLGVTVPVVANDSMTLLLQPMLGVGFDYKLDIPNQKSADGPDSLYPQIFAFLSADKFFFFHWTINTYTSIFHEEAVNEIYTRNYLTYALNDIIAIGPQYERVQSLGDEGALLSQTIGGRININYGKNNTLGIYVGYETEKFDEETGLTGRMNFTRLW